MFFDVETTGLVDPEIVQLFAWTNDETGIIQGFFRSKKPIEIGAMATHHITNEMVKDCSLFSNSEQIRGLNALSGKFGHTFIAHNAEFDIGCVKRYGIVPDKFICTMHVAKAFFKYSGKKPESYGLQYLRYFAGLEFDESINPHDAKSDVLVLMSLYGLLKTQFSINEMIEITKEALKPQNFEFRFGKHRGKTIGEIAKIERSYLRWCLENQGDDIKSKIIAFKESIQ